MTGFLCFNSNISHTHTTAILFSICTIPVIHVCGLLFISQTYGVMLEVISFNCFLLYQDVDIKKQNPGITTYAFLQYVDIDGAMRAKQRMDREFIGRNRIKVIV